MTEGEADGPYTSVGEPVVDTADVVVTGDVSMDDNQSSGNTVVVDQVDLSEGGFVTIHDASLFAGETLGSVRGTSEYLGPGTHEDVSVQIDEVPGGEDTFVAMAYQDTNGNEAYDFVDEEGDADGPYTAGGEPVTDAAQVSGASESGTTQTDADGNDTQDGGGDTQDGDGTTQDDGAGFGAVVALLAIVGGLLVARRRS